MQRREVGNMQFAAGVTLLLLGTPLAVLAALARQWLFFAMGSTFVALGVIYLAGWTLRRPRPDPRAADAAIPGEASLVPRSGNVFDMGIRMWSWLWTPRRAERKPDMTCPICGGVVVVAAMHFSGSQFTGPMAAPRPREELIVACAVHGRPPFNDATLEHLRNSA